MKKIFPLLIIALLFSTSCLTLFPQKESAPQIDTVAAPPKETSTPTEKPRIPFTPQRRATPTQTNAAQQWTFSAPAPTNRSIYKQDLAPEYYAVLESLPYASAYSIEFSIADDLQTVTGHETVTYTNAEETNLKEIHLRLFPNILNGKMTVDNVAVNKRKVKTSLSLENSLLILRLEEELPPGESVTIDMDFDIEVAQDLGTHYSVQAYYDNILTLAHAYPMIAVYDDEGWNSEVPSQYGDLTYADMSFYIVTVEAPAQVILVASGREINREEKENRQRVIFAAGPARDFFLAASPDFSIFTKESSGVTLNFYAPQSNESGAKYALNVAARALELFSERYTPYPYHELDFVSTPTTAGGVEYPGAIAISKQYIEPGNIYLEAITAHETGHQWFYNLVGNDQLDDPWLDESLTQFVTLQYFSETGSAEGFRQDLKGRWAYINNEDTPMGLPVTAYSQEQYSGIIYGRGALFFEALRDEMGAEMFDSFIRDYTQENAWGIATPEILKKEAESHCGCDLTPLFQEWVYP